jgi:integrase
MRHTSQDAVRSMLRLIPSDRWRLAATMQYLHGLRASEVLALRLKDTEGNALYVPRLKGSKATLQELIYAPSDPIFNERTLLKRFLSNKDLSPDSLLFGSGLGKPMETTLPDGTVKIQQRDKSYYTYLRAVKAAATKAGWPPKMSVTHVLKHSIAMHLVKQIDIKDLQTYLGHVTLASTGIYLESNDAQASAAVAKVFAEEEK